MNFRCPKPLFSVREEPLPCFSLSGAWAPTSSRTPSPSFCARTPLVHQHQLPPRRRLSLQCCVGAPETDADGLSPESSHLASMAQEEEDEIEQMVFLSDPATDREIQCGVDQIIQHKGSEYYLFYPRHEPVFFAEVSEDDELVAVEEGPDVRGMIPAATAVLAEDHVELRDTAFVLTVDEDLALTQVAEDGDEDGGEEEEGDDAVDDEDEEDEEGDSVEVISEFRYEGRHILIAKPTEPTLLVAEKKGEDFRVIVGKELDAISGALENEIAS